MGKNTSSSTSAASTSLLATHFASQPISKKEPEPVPPATETITTIRNLLVSSSRLSFFNISSRDNPAFNTLSLERILSLTRVYLSKKYKRDTARICPAPLAGSMPSSRIFFGVSGSQFWICG